MSQTDDLIVSISQRIDLLHGITACAFDAFVEGANDVSQYAAPTIALIYDLVLDIRTDMQRLTASK